MTRFHVEMEYRSGGLANISAYPSKEAAWAYLRKSEEQKERHKADILFSSLTDTDDSDEDPLSRIAILERMERRYIYHVRPCAGHNDCAACWEAGLIE